MTNKPIPVILDTDIGTDIDDTWALAMLLGSPELDLKLVVTEHGDTTYRAKLAAKFLETAGHGHVPVGIGVEEGEKVNYFQKPWVGDYSLEDYPGAVHADGVQAMIDFIMASPEPVTIIAIGIVSNLAKALEIEPRIAEKARFVGMHGSIHVGYNGSDEISPEANVVNDVDSFRKVIAAPWLETIITPLDTCGLIVLDGERYQQVRQSEKPILKAVMENYEVWAGLVEWLTVDYTDTKSSTLFDTVAIYLAYATDLVEMETVSISTTDKGLNVIDPQGASIQAALRWKNMDGFYAHLVERLLTAK